MHTGTGEIKDLGEVEEMKAKKNPVANFYKEIPAGYLPMLQGMNRKQRREWYKSTRKNGSASRKKGKMNDDIRKWPRCNDDIGDGTLCNAEMVDGGEGVGMFCSLCELRETMCEQREQIAALSARNKELTEALEKYGSHSPADGSPICERSKHSDHPCTCGFEAALGGKP